MQNHVQNLDETVAATPTIQWRGGLDSRIRGTDRQQLATGTRILPRTHTLPDGCARVHDVVDWRRRVQCVHNASVQHRLLYQLLGTGVHSRILGSIRYERTCVRTWSTQAACTCRTHVRCAVYVNNMHSCACIAYT